MKQLDSSSKQVMVDTRPLFSSVWLALFFEIRKNYNHRHPEATAGVGNVKEPASKKTDLSIN